MTNSIYFIIMSVCFVVSTICCVAVTIKFFLSTRNSVDNLPTGVEYMDEQIIDENNPTFTMLMEAYKSASASVAPSEFLQQEIEDEEDGSVEVVTDLDEYRKETLRRGY